MAKTTSRKPAQDAPAVVEATTPPTPAKATPTDAMLEASPVTAPIMARVSELRAKQASLATGDDQLRADMSHAAHAVRDSSHDAVRAIQSLARLVCPVDGDGVPCSQDLTDALGSVSPHGHKVKSSAVADFLSAAQTYRKARKAYCDSITGSDPLSREIASLLKHARAVYALIA